MSDAKTQRVLMDACLGVIKGDELTGGLPGFLAAHGVLGSDADAFLAFPTRLALYRRLVRNNLLGVTAKMLPRTRARLNAFANGAFDETFDSFLAEVGPRSHFLRDVPQEFLTWAAPRWVLRGDIPRYLADLAAHELIEFQMAAAPVAGTPRLAEVSLDRGLVFAEAKRLVRYDYRVHALPDDLEDRSEPHAGHVSLLVYRSAEHAVRFLELTPLAATILERLFAGSALGLGIAEACAAAGVAANKAVLDDTAKLLADLGERGILLGAADAIPAPSAP
jgi:hypothetical protein